MITLIGLGPADAGGLSVAARDALRAAPLLFVRTERHPAANDLRAECIQFESFDAVYDAAATFDQVYDEIVDRLLTLAHVAEVAYAVPGHPLVAEESVRMLLQRARVAGVGVRIVGSESFIEPALTALDLSLSDGLFIVDALSLGSLRPRVNTGMLIFQVYDRAVASELKLALMRDYPDDWEVAVVRSAGVPNSEAVERLPLHRLDRAEVDHLTAVYVPPLPADLRKPTFD